MADGGIQREVRQAIRGRALPAVRSLAWRVLGPPPQPEPSVRRWSDLRRHGLRVEDGLGLYARGTRGITVHFEPPAQLNNATMQMYGKLHIGRYSFMRSGIVRFVREIGRYTSIGPGVVLGEAEHPVHWLTSSPSAYHHGRWLFYPPEVDARDRLIPRDEQTVDMATLQSIEIGNDVWIGANAIVRRGVRIGDGAVVGAGAFVNRDVPPYAVVGGLPARQIGQRFSDAVIARLMAVRWWEFDISDLAGVDFSDVEGALTDIEAREAAGTITRVPPQFNSVRLKNDGYRSVTVHPDNRAREEARLARTAR